MARRTPSAFIVDERRAEWARTDAVEIAMEVADNNDGTGDVAVGVCARGATCWAVKLTNVIELRRIAWALDWDTANLRIIDSP